MTRRETRREAQRSPVAAHVISAAPVASALLVTRRVRTVAAGRGAAHVRAIRKQAHPHGTRDVIAFASRAPWRSASARIGRRQRDGAARALHATGDSARADRLIG